jgi:hypothetical protein
MQTKMRVKFTTIDILLQVLELDNFLGKLHDFIFALALETFIEFLLLLERFNLTLTVKYLAFQFFKGIPEVDE